MPRVLTWISAGALQDVLLDRQSNNDAVVSYFYFDFHDAEKQSSKRAVRSLLLQCVRQDHDGARALEQLYRQCSDGQQQPAEHTVQAILQDVLARPTEKYVVLDALDECTGSSRHSYFSPDRGSLEASEPTNF